MQFSPLIEEMIEALRCLPGVGPKSAQRMALHLLERDRSGGERLAEVLGRSMQEVGHCRSCRTLTEEELCAICASGKRKSSVLCVVETPADMLALEQTGAYDGQYFVLLGHLSPLEGIGPEDLGFDELLSKLDAEPVEEIILATNPTLEGETTAQYLAELLSSRAVKVTHLAQGIPLGGELEYLDGGTLSRAFAGRLGFNRENQ
ncbi:recombination mediator RecR [Marinospirillum perlucidum]|uniref:recombination mediator RecR n=1 Tax=Marinospirillum perlucidum TaxID=1982602 RepID=UPI000DF12096|nr:recombination mediator RecR [Marinospirillum perlucidum]